MRSSRQCSLFRTGARRFGLLCVSVLVAAVSMTGCATSNEASRSANNDAEYRDRLDALSKIYEERDVQKIMGLYAQDTYSLSFDQALAFDSGTTDHRQTVERLLEQVAELKVTWDPDVSVDKTSDRVWTTRHFRMNAKLKSGADKEITGWHSAIWEQREGVWLIAYEHFAGDQKTVFIPPPPAPPIAPPALVPEAEETRARNLIRDIFFDYDKWDIRSEDLASLGIVLDYLTKYPGTKITIEGHCDERGTSRYNIDLGQKRADETKAWLVGKGVAADRLQTISFGKSRPFEQGRSEEAWQSNRRSHFVVTKGPQQP